MYNVSAILFFNKLVIKAFDSALHTLLPTKFHVFFVLAVYIVGFIETSLNVLNIFSLIGKKSQTVKHVSEIRIFDIAPVLKSNLVIRAVKPGMTC